MDSNNVAGADARGPNDADRNLPAARWLRAIIPADRGWTVNGIDPYDLESSYRGVRAREIQVPIVAWGIDGDGEIQPIVRGRRGVLRTVADVFGGGDSLLAITPPDDWPSCVEIVGPGVSEEGGAQEVRRVQRIREAAAGE